MSGASSSKISYEPHYPGRPAWYGVKPVWSPVPLQPSDNAPAQPAPQPVQAPLPVVSGPAPGWTRTFATREAVDTTKAVTLKQATDDGAGNLPTTDGGIVEYATGLIRFKPTDAYRYRKYNESRTSISGPDTGTWTEETDNDTWGNGSLVRVWYREDSVTPTVRTENFAAQNIAVNLTPYTGDAVVPGSVMFRLGTSVYVDRAGTLYRDISVTTGSGMASGTVDYETGLAIVTDWAEGSTDFELLSLLTVRGQWTDTGADLRTASSPIAPESLNITATAVSGDVLQAVADADGIISGTYARGAVNYEMGTAWVEFGEQVGPDWVPREVDPASIRYNAVAYSFLPLPADIVGIDAVRLPSDGRVPIYRPGDVVLVMHAAETAPATVANGGTINCGRTRIGWIRVIDAGGESHPTGFELDRATGIVTYTDVSEMTMPVRVRHTVADLRVVTDVQITGELTLSRPLSHTFPAGETLVASCLLHGDRRARVSAVWDQQTWNGTWVDNLVGNEATATLDVIAHPIEVTNEGAETERWLLRWTSTTNVELIGQRRGLVFSGPFSADIAPINPRTRAEDGTGGVPYLVIPVAANGGGWSTGNVVRINTVGAIAPIWMARAIQQSEEPMDDGADGCEIYCLGNIDRP